MSIEDSQVLGNEHEHENKRWDAEDYVNQELAPFKPNTIESRQPNVFDGQRREPETEQWSFAEHATESTAPQHTIPEDIQNTEEFQYSENSSRNTQEQSQQPLHQKVSRGNRGGRTAAINETRPLQGSQNNLSANHRPATISRCQQRVQTSSGIQHRVLDKEQTTNRPVNLSSSIRRGHR